MSSTLAIYIQGHKRSFFSVRGLCVGYWLNCRNVEDSSTYSGVYTLPQIQGNLLLRRSSPGPGTIHTQGDTDPGEKWPAYKFEKCSVTDNNGRAFLIW